MMSVEVLTGPEGQSVPGQTTKELSELPQFPHSTLCVPMRPKGLHRLEPACGKAISALLGKSERTFPRSGAPTRGGYFATAWFGRPFVPFMM